MIMIGTNAVLTHTHVVSIPFISASTQTHVHTLTQWTGDPIHCLLGNYNWFKITLLTTALAYTHTHNHTHTHTNKHKHTCTHTLCVFPCKAIYMGVCVHVFKSVRVCLCKTLKNISHFNTKSCAKQNGKWKRQTKSFFLRQRRWRRRLWWQCWQKSTFYMRGMTHETWMVMVGNGAQKYDKKS